MGWPEKTPPEPFSCVVSADKVPRGAILAVFGFPLTHGLFPSLARFWSSEAKLP